MKRFDAKHSRVEIRVRFQKFAERATGDAAATRNREMRMPRPQFRLDPHLERRFLDAFVKLKKMRMTRSHADPNYFHHSFRWKCSDDLDWKKECFEIDCLQFFPQRKIDILRDVWEKSEREMNLIPHCPAHAANVWIEIDEKFSN